MTKNILLSIMLLTMSSSSLLAQGFQNVAANYGLDFAYATREYGGGLSFVDFDQDGWDDLTFATEIGQPVRFFRNIDGAFQEIAPLIRDTSEAKQLLWVDYNNDKLLDLYLAGEGKNKLYRNNGQLQLEEVTTTAGLDFPDLVSYCSTWFDYDLDGKLDLLVAHRTTDKAGWIDLYRNVDYHTFEKMTIPAGLKNKGKSVLAMTSFDYNNDGWQDIFLGQDWEKGNQLFRNNGNGTFTDVSEQSNIDYKMNSMTATVMDINEDGWQDLYISNTTQGNILLVNNQRGGFEEKAAYYKLNLRNVTFGTVFFDADNDGDNDVHIGGLQINFTFENPNDQEAFKRKNNEWGFKSDNEFNNGVAVSDFNNDGFVDIAKNSVTRGNLYVSKNSLWKNQFQKGNYIKIKLVGTVSNYAAIGSSISLYHKGTVQHKRIGCGESFSSQHSLIQHFGLNAANSIDSIVVNWTSGNISVLKEVPTQQLISITESPYGCMDVQACNYNKNAQFDKGNCRYATDFYDCLACTNDADQDGICDELEVYDCTKQDACNYRAEATEDDGSCYYLPNFNIEGEQTPIALTKSVYSYPMQAGSSYEWIIENGSILAGQTSSEVTVIWYEKGQGKLKIRETNTAACIGSWVQKNLQIMPAIVNYYNEPWITPNPVADILNIHNLSHTNYQYKIYNSIGKLLKQGVQSGNNQLWVQELTTGVYVIEIQQHDYFFRQFFYKE